MTATAGPELEPAAPLVSVIVANYNGAAHLAEAIASAQRQTLRDIEIIVSDDASSDDSVATVERLMAQDPRVKLIRAERNAGPGAARNRALALAKGAWLAVMDSDDVMHEERLQKLTTAAAADGADIAADNLLEFGDDPSRPARAFLTGRRTQAAFWVDAADYVASNCFYSRKPALGYLKPIFRASSFSREALRYNESLRIGEDYDLVVRLLRAGARFRIYPIALYFYRRHVGSTSHRLSESALIAIQAADCRLHETFSDPDRRLASALARRSRSIETALAYERLLAALKTGNWKAALNSALTSPGAVPLLRMPAIARLNRLASLAGASAATIVDRSPAGGGSAQRLDRAIESAAEQVAVCICTFRRPLTLLVAMESIAKQALPQTVRLEMVVIDNDRRASAQSIVEQFAANASFPVRYRHSPGENISVARNAALDAAEARWLAFIDDDERASPHWLAQLLEMREGAHAIFGPCEAIYGETAPAWMKRADFHSNRIAAPALAIETGYTSNVLIDASFVRRHGLRFDVALGRSGGEDTMFFHALHKQGGILRYAPRATVYEDVASSRATAKWIARRRYRAGQTYALMLRRFSPRRYSLSAWTSPLKIGFCAAASLSSAFNSARASWWLMRGVFHLGVLSFALGGRLHQEYEPSRNAAVGRR